MNTPVGPDRPRRRITRRGVLKAGLIGVPAVLATATAGFGWAWVRADVDTTDDVTFRNRLAIPPLDTGRIDGSGRRTFELRATAGRSRLRSGPPTTTWGYNGSLLGPTLRAARGEQVAVTVHNALSEVTTVHWHGMRLPAQMDGGPHQPIPPAATWSPHWTIDQPAATLWYHPHPHGTTAQQVYRGLAGLFLLDEASPTPTGLPDEYGVDDIPVIVQDKNFTGDNQFDDQFSTLLGDVGVLGDTLLVNGTIGAYLEVVTERVRLRLLNASNARIYRFGFADGRSFQLVGTDGGLLPAAHESDRIQLSPGERAEIVVTVRAGEQPVLRSFPPDLGLDPINNRFTGGDDAFDVLQLRAARALRPSAAISGPLAEVSRLAPGSGATTRRFELSGKQINGRIMDPDRIDFTAAADTVELWDVVSPFPKPHNFHVHGTQFQVLSVNGRPPPPELSGWKDTVFTPPEAAIRLAIRFSGEADPHHPLMFHCHLLAHEDHGMMGQFVVRGPD